VTKGRFDLLNKEKLFLPANAIKPQGIQLFSGARLHIESINSGMEIQ
jgi:hypothetical protein